jgi:hypothetical protein
MIDTLLENLFAKHNLVHPDSSVVRYCPASAEHLISGKEVVIFKPDFEVLQPRAGLIFSENNQQASLLAVQALNCQDTSLG